jgi:hypothetical protein
LARVLDINRQHDFEKNGSFVFIFEIFGFSFPSKDFGWKPSGIQPGCSRQSTRKTYILEMESGD